MVGRSYLLVGILAGVVCGAAAGGENAQTQFANEFTFSFTAVAPLPGGTVAHSACALANGDILVTGGYGELFGLPIAASHGRIFDHKKQIWRAVGGFMKYGRLQHSSILLGDGKVLIVGGRGQDRKRMRSVEIFDPGTEMFELVGFMAVPRSRACLNLLPASKVLITGGHKTAEIVEPSPESPCGYCIRELTEKTVFRHDDHTATTLADGAVLLAAGRTKAIERFDPVSETFTACKAKLPSVLDDQAAFLLYDGKVFLAGGQEIYSNKSVGQTWIYDPEADTLTEGPKLHSSAAGADFAGAADLMGVDLFAYDRQRRGRYIFICGGEYDPGKDKEDVVLDSAAIYDAVGNRLIDVGPMLYGHDEFAIAALPVEDGRVRVLIMAGYGPGDSFQTNCEQGRLVFPERLK